MRVKEYNISKTAFRTAKDNALLLTDGIANKTKRLFDFSLLDDMTISEEEKEVIKADAVRGVTAANKVSFYGKLFDDFYACDGIAKYFCHRVFGVEGKHLYNIFQLASVEHAHKERKSIYENKYIVTNYNASEGYTEPINDIEI